MTSVSLSKKPLAIWAKCQLRQFNLLITQGDRRSNMTLDRISKLARVGCVFNPSKMKRPPSKTPLAIWAKCQLRQFNLLIILKATGDQICLWSVYQSLLESDASSILAILSDLRNRELSQNLKETSLLKDFAG
jgi:hypothetical protein